MSLGVVVKQAWGMSELAPIGSVNPDGDNRPGSSGVAVASMLYKIVDPESGELLPRGEEGEVVCTGPNVMSGYLNNPEATAHAFDADGWFRTGDIGYADDSFLHDALSFGYESAWDEFMGEVEPFAARVPYMVSEG